MKCLLCENSLTKSQIYEVKRGKAKGYCSRKCSGLAQTINIEYQHNCKNCGKDFVSIGKGKKPIILTCSKECDANLKSNRMKEKNPMSSKITREKVSKTLKAIGHKPIILGGNGRGTTIPQDMLFKELDETFVCELAVRTGDLKSIFKLPNCVKVDIASIEHMIAIEIDGSSHNSASRKEQDKRKEEFLCTIGWKVLRFTNKEVMNGLEQVVEKIKSMI